MTGEAAPAVVAARWSALRKVRLTVGAPSHGPPPRIARGGGRRRNTAQPLPEPGRRIRDPPPARRLYVVLGHVVAPSRPVRDLLRGDQDRVLRVSTPLRPHECTHRTRGRRRRRGRARRTLASEPDDDLAAALVAALHVHWTRTTLTPCRNRPGRRSSRRTRRTRVTCRRPVPPGCRYQSSIPRGCTRGALRRWHGVRP